MNKDEIISMAREAGMITPEGHCETVSFDIAERFAALAFESGAKHEREMCAEEAESAASDDNKYDIAASIRARNNKE